MNLKLLKNKNLFLLVLGQFVSQFGSGMQSFAFSLYVLRLTGSGSQFASVLAIGMLPRLILGPICGVFADWFDRKKIIVYLDFASGLLIGGLFYISITSTLTLLHIYLAVILLSVISSLFAPAISTAIPSVVEKDDLIAANSLHRLFMTVCNLIYPIAAGAIFGIYGISIVLLVNSLSFIFSALSEMFIDLETPNKKKSGFSFNSFSKDFKAGISFIIGKSLIRKIILVSVIANALVAPSFSVGLIYVANMVIKISDLQLGILQTLLIVGTLIGSLVSGLVGKRLSLAKMIYLALLGIGIIICLIAVNSTSTYLNVFNNNLIPYITLTFLGFTFGVIVVMTNIGVSTLLQREVPLDIMGRVMSVKETASMCAIPLGQMAFGIMFDSMASFIPLLISGGIVVMSAVIFDLSINKDNAEENTRKDVEVIIN